jgi:hypothetical protein
MAAPLRLQSATTAALKYRMLNKTILALTLAFALPFASAQTQPQPQTQSQPSSPAKKELVARILKVQQPGIEAMARGLAEQPAMELMRNASNALPSRVAKDKQEAVAKDIQGDVQKYLADTVPVVQARAVKLAPATIGALLEERFTEDELKQVVAMVEAPVYSKFQRMGDDMQRALIEKLIAEMRSTVEPKIRALEETVGKRLGVTASGAAPTAPTAPRAPAKPAKPASK